MKYEEYEGKMEELIGQKLQEIEKKEQIKILHAVESGSRSWGWSIICGCRRRKILFHGN